MSPAPAALPPLAILVGILAVTTRNPPVISVAIAVLVLATVFGRRVEAGPGPQRVLLGILAAVGFGVGTALAPQAREATERLGAPWLGIALALALPTLARPAFARPEAGSRLTFTLGLFALACAGQTRTGRGFVFLGWAFVAACVVAMRYEDPDRPRARALPLSRLLATAAILASSAGTVALAARVLPPLHARAIERVMRALRGMASTGFDERFALGSLESMLVSEEIVARVYGPAPEMLRGLVYDRYSRGQWVARAALPRTLTTPRGPSGAPHEVTVERVGAPAGVLFVPLEHRGLATLGGLARIDRFGALRPAVGDSSSRIWYLPGARTDRGPAAPSPDDTEVPPELAASLEALARRWTRGATGREDAVHRIVRALREGHRYRLAVERDRRVDPVLDFLFTHREGNCEYFASATALLARAAGVPARVVGGYRVGEFNPVGRFAVVRDRNAHAWVEAWGDRDAWVTVDPTPERAIPVNRRHNAPVLRALLDAAAAWFAVSQRWFAARTARELLGLAGSLLGAWLLWRRLRTRRAVTVAERTFAADTPPLACLARLDAALALRGLGRHPGETLARHAARLEADETLAPALRAELVAALQGYAALRYGGGDEDAVAHALDAVTTRLRRPLP